MLRQVDANDLVTQAAEVSIQTRKTPARGKVLDDSQLADVFGIEMDIPADLPETKKKMRRTGTRKSKAAELPAVASKRPAKKTAKATTRKKSVSIADSQFRKAHAPATEKTAAGRKSIKFAPGKPALQEVAANTPAQTKRKKAQA
ncbi:MAG: hypothetical protein M0Z36_09905 [Thermaerobacter sp.]|nr:hypothetical protein [Gammaproteobacteria bacterium]MDA8206373.1 hypothetical protein [Thermaerobacter sp.]